jgi:hypothetical protein
MRGVLARIALAASQIVASYERFGPDQPWGFCGPDRLEVQHALVPRVAQLPGRPRALATRKPTHDRRNQRPTSQKTNSAGWPPNAAGRWRPRTSCRVSGAVVGAAVVMRPARSLPPRDPLGLVGRPGTGRDPCGPVAWWSAMTRASGMTCPASSRSSWTSRGWRRCCVTAASRFIPSAIAPASTAFSRRRL